ncbi:MAG: TlpA family protein disulfide reductase [Nocardioides sp.]|uniref:TlpA family protein disulfide reductase n=1 Tax=Nocardioides sp. TaxID=35761 RepID=UPI00262F03C8|nr:TlpA disulfide reductase family protein [Nocardioides sp.]MCW2835662.1 TlpA family protein disulfide reductase [Nocardioides sp.]
MIARSVVALIALVALTTSACSSLEGTGDKGYISNDATVTQIPVGDREEPIDLTGDDLEGNAISLAELRGGVVVVNVWGAWCPPCRAEQPDLVAAAELTSGVADFVGINIRDASVANALAFVRTNDVPYPSIYDPDSQALLTFSEVMPVRSPPTTFVLDAEGRIAAAIFGPVPSVTTLVDIVEEIAEETAGQSSG